MLSPQYLLPLADELVVDLFAGGGGASTGIEAAIGRHVDIAVNHDADAVGMHEANHPQTKHYCSDVFEVDPLEATGGRPVGLLHASPDCTHHSQALGGQPRSRAIRSLAWAVHKWVGKTKPRVVTLENEKQMLLWSPLVAKRCAKTGRVVRVDGSVAAPGERVPVNEQWLVPCPKRVGRNWKHFIAGLRAMGATAIEWRVIVNAELGAHSTRERLYVVARFDGEPIVWPQQTHAKKPKAGQKPWRPAHECIDWSVPGRSIFGRERPLAEATMRRIAVGMRRYVLGAAEPFIVGVGGRMGQSPARPVSAPAQTVTSKADAALLVPTLMPLTHQGGHRNHSVADPLPTVTAAHRGELALAAATLVPVTHSRDVAHDVKQPLRTVTTAKGGETALAAATLVQMGYGERQGQAPRALDLDLPLGTVTAGGIKHAVAAAYLVQAGHGEGNGTTRRRSHGVNDIAGPVGTVTASGGGQSLGAAYLVQANGGFNSTPARDARDPLSTVTTSGSQQQLVTAHLTTLRRNSDGRDLREPVPTITASGEHQGLVEYHLSKEHEEGALRCAAFLMRYHGTGGQWASLREPMTTVTTHDRLALVTVWLRGEPWVIVDITLRMLLPRELYNAQDFPASYIIDRTASGKKLTKTAQVRMCGNSVSPVPMEALVRANYAAPAAARRAA